MKTRAAFVAVAGVLLAWNAEAHVSISSGPAYANRTNLVVFSVGHGCAGADTLRITVDMPAGVTSVRAMFGDFGKPTLRKDAAGTVTAVTWQKPDADLLDSDYSYYSLPIRMRIPDRPFSTIYFVVHQTCRAADGTETTVDWASLPGDPAPDGGAKDEPAAALKVLPARLPGWNKYTVPAAMTDLAEYFGDALIVWKGTAAYSPNPGTTALITATSGVTALGALAAGDEIWVRY